MKILCRPVSNKENWDEEKEKFLKCNSSQRYRTLQYKVIEKVKDERRLWHPDHEKDCRAAKSYATIRKSINKELGTRYTSK